MNQKGFISVILTVVITALLVGGGTYVMVQDQAEEQITKVVQETTSNIQKQAQVQLETLNKKVEELELFAKEEAKKENLGLATWQTYINEEYDYSFQYPSDWLEPEVEPGRFEGEIFGTSLQRIGLGGTTSYEGEDGRKYYVNIYPYKSPEEISDKIVEFPMTSVKARATINGHKAMVIDSGGMCAYKYLLLFDEEYFISIFLNCGGESIENISIAYDMLYSIKFLNSVTSDWQVYNNSKYNFSITFPENWEGYQFEEKDNAVEFGFKEDDIFLISAMLPGEWEILKNETGPKPKYITENEDYVFVYSGSHDNKEENWDAAKKTESIIKTFKLLEDVSDWQTYTNNKQNFSFQYPSNWQILSDGEFDMSVGIIDGTKQYMRLIVNPDGFGPHFPDKSYALGRADGHLVVVSEETHEVNVNNDDEHYQIIASDNSDSVRPYFWMSFGEDTDDKIEWEKTVKKIITSLYLLD
jgi:hypothetical protein